MRERLATARLYVVCDAAFLDRLPAALAGGADIVQLREKRLSGASLRRAAERARALTREAGALFVVNDDPRLAAAVDADGVHVGQADAPTEEARAIVGPERLVGLSTHTPEEVDAAEADYIGVGPVHATPTKPGRPAVGLELVTHAAAHARIPWFAIGGIDALSLPGVLAAGATRVAVVRAVTESPDPEAAARALRAALPEPVVAAGQP